MKTKYTNFSLAVTLAKEKLGLACPWRMSKNASPMRHRLLKRPTPTQFIAATISVFCCLLLITSCQPTTTPDGPLTRIERVVSGQTLEITNGKSKVIQRVRLIGIKAPDLRQKPWGPQARKQLEHLIDGKPVLLEFDVEKEDRYQRKLAYVWQGNILLNEKLVADGYVLAASQLPNTKYDKRLMRAQEKARIMGRGIWDSNQPMRLTPTEFRERYR